MHDHVFFDAETTGVEDSSSIICAVTIRNGTVARYREAIPGRLTPATAKLLALDLLRAPCVVTFNGAAFDFKLLAYHLDDKQLATKLARKAVFEHKDIMFDFFCHNGYMTSMQSLLVASGCAGKTLTGKEAATLWETDIKTVVDYCVSDVECLVSLTTKLKDDLCLSRVAKTSGKTHVWVPFNPGDIRRVYECLAQHGAASPDTSFMTSPPDPKEAVEWTRDFLV